MPLLGIGIGAAIGSVFAARMWRGRAIEQQEQGIVECAFRDTSGSVSPLMRRWRHGRAELSPGVISFVAFVPLGFRIPRPRTATIEIPVALVASDPRRSKGAERLFFQGMVYEVDTGAATIEWGLAPFTDMAWAIAAVTPDASPGDALTSSLT